MQLGMLYSPVTTLGPGSRVGLWTRGCSKRCEGCISPNLQNYDPLQEIPVSIIKEMIECSASFEGCSGLTISGGDPFEQAQDLLELLKLVRSIFDDILVYTGYTIEEIKADSTMEECLNYIDVLIDGRYIQEMNTGKSILCGSDNQRIHFLNKDLYNKYAPCVEGKRKTESFIHDGKVTIVGIP